MDALEINYCLDAIENHEKHLPLLEEVFKSTSDDWNCSKKIWLRLNHKYA